MTFKNLSRSWWLLYLITADLFLSLNLYDNEAHPVSNWSYTMKIQSPQPLLPSPVIPSAILHAWWFISWILPATLCILCRFRLPAVLPYTLYGSVLCGCVVFLCCYSECVLLWSWTFAMWNMRGHQNLIKHVVAMYRHICTFVQSSFWTYLYHAFLPGCVYFHSVSCTFAMVFIPSFTCRADNTLWTSLKEEGDTSFMCVLIFINTCLPKFVSSLYLKCVIHKGEFVCAYVVSSYKICELFYS